MIEFLKRSAAAQADHGPVRKICPRNLQFPQQLQLTIPTMTCAGCVTRITQAVQKVDINATVQSVPRQPHQLWIQTQTSEAIIRQAIVAIGHCID